MKRRTLRRGLVAALGIGVLAVAGTASGAPDPTYPHLPKVAGQLQGTITDTVGYVTPARQWIRVPQLTLAADVETLANYGQPTSACQRNYGAAMCTPPSDAQYRLTIHARAYPVSASDPLEQSRFADFPAVKVRMVAFGSIPAEATVHLSLPLDEDGLPVGLLAAGVDDQFAGDKGPAAGTYPATTYYDLISDSIITGKVIVRLSDLTVDGVPVALGDDCRTVSPATLDGRGLGFTRLGSHGDEVPSGHYNPRAGGTIDATLDVPHFTGCGVGADDLDPLVSAMASGSGFPVKVSQGALGGCWTSPPSRMDDSTCGMPEPLHFPARDAS